MYIAVGYAHGTDGRPSIIYNWTPQTVGEKCWHYSQTPDG